MAQRVLTIEVNVAFDPYDDEGQITNDDMMNVIYEAYEACGWRDVDIKMTGMSEYDTEQVFRIKEYRKRHPFSYPGGAVHGIPEPEDNNNGC